MRARRSRRAGRRLLDSRESARARARAYADLALGAVIDRARARDLRAGRQRGAQLGDHGGRGLELVAESEESNAHASRVQRIEVQRLAQAGEQRRDLRARGDRVAAGRGYGAGLALRVDRDLRLGLLALGVLRSRGPRLAHLHALREHLDVVDFVGRFGRQARLVHDHVEQRLDARVLLTDRELEQQAELSLARRRLEHRVDLALDRGLLDLAQSVLRGGLGRLPFARCVLGALHLFLRRVEPLASGVEPHLDVAKGRLPALDVLGLLPQSRRARFGRRARRRGRRGLGGLAIIDARRGAAGRGRCRLVRAVATVAQAVADARRREEHRLVSRRVQAREAWRGGAVGRARARRGVRLVRAVVEAVAEVVVDEFGLDDVPAAAARAAVGQRVLALRPEAATHARGEQRCEQDSSAQAHHQIGGRDDPGPDELRNWSDDCSRGY